MYLTTRPSLSLCPSLSVSDTFPITIPKKAFPAQTHIGRFSLKGQKCDRSLLPCILAHRMMASSSFLLQTVSVGTGVFGTCWVSAAGIHHQSTVTLFQWPTEPWLCISEAAKILWSRFILFFFEGAKIVQPYQVE